MGALSEAQNGIWGFRCFPQTTVALVYHLSKAPALWKVCLLTKEKKSPQG